MQTSKSISTISYNTKEYLTLKLNELLESKIISYWHFIKHKADLDDTKDHIHLYIEPNKRIDTMSLMDHFKEKDLSNDKPLGVIAFRLCNSLADWLWYGIHDETYLMGKNLVRNYHYTFDDIVASDYSNLHYLILDNPRPDSENDIIIRDIMKGYTNLEIMRDLKTPTFRYKFVSEGINMIRQAQARKGFKPISEDENGELNITLEDLYDDL